MMATFLGLNVIFDKKPHVWMDVGLVFLFYGLYYGVLGRDISEICADKMAAHVGVRKIQSIQFTKLTRVLLCTCIIGDAIFIPVLHATRYAHQIFG